MKTSFKELKDAQQSFARILDVPILPSLSYRMHKQAGKIKEAQKAIEKNNRDSIKKYGEEKDGRISVPEAKLKEFHEEVEKFLEAEFDLEMQLIPWECIEQGGIKISATDLAVLKNFIEMPAKLK